MVSIANNSATAVPAPMSLNCEDTSSILSLAYLKPRRWQDLRPFEKILVFVVGVVSLISLILIIVVACLGSKLSRVEGDLSSYAHLRTLDGNASHINSNSSTSNKNRDSSTTTSPHQTTASTTKYNVVTKSPSSTSTPSPSSKSECSKLCLDSECTLAAGEMIRSMDLSRDPCKDFYRFACGNWAEKNPIPDSKSRHDQFETLSDQIFRHIHYIVESESDEVSDPEPVRMAQKFYKDCKHQKNENNYTELKHFVDHLMNEFDNNVGKTLGHLRRALGHNFLFNLYVGLDEKNPTKHVVYLDQPVFPVSRSLLVSSIHHDNEIVDAYQLLVDETWHKVFGTDGRAAEVASNVIEIERTLASISASPLERTDKSLLYNPHTVQSLHEMTEAPDLNISWESYLDEVFFEIYDPKEFHTTWNHTTVIVRNVEFFDKLDTVLTGEHAKTMLRDFLSWKIIFSLIHDVSNELRELVSDFYEAQEGILAVDPLWKTCVEETNQFFGMALSYHYVQEYFDEENKQEVQLIVDEIKRTLRKTLTTDRELAWMSKLAKKRAVEKLDKLEIHIGHPDWLIDGGHPANKTLLITQLADYYYHLELDKDNDHFQNVIEVFEWKSKEHLKKIRHSREVSDRWLVEPTAVTAQNSPLHNSLILPAGVLQPPFYGHYNIYGATSNPIQYLNFGAIGSIISHVMFHVIDHRGSQYLADGTLHDWWDEETNKNYEEKADCYTKQFTKFLIQNFTWPVHWKKTLVEESVADNVGLHLAYKAYQSYIRSNSHKEDGGIKLLPGIAESANQMFFLSYAQMWCSAYRMDELVGDVKNDADYVPAQFRETGGLHHSPEFQKAFSCPATSSEFNCNLW